MPARHGKVISPQTNGGNDIRAIDIHEDAICEVVDMVQDDVLPCLAYARVSIKYGISRERLEHLTRVWCAIGGIQAP